MMISSRCNTEIKDGDNTVSLSDIRLELKEIIESETFFNNKIFQVWISEEPRDASALESSWEEVCLKS